MVCPGLVSKLHMLKAHIPPEGHVGRTGPGRVPPGPLGRAFFRADQLHGALVGLRLLLHDGKDALSSGQGGQKEIPLLGKLVDGQGGLADKDQIAGQAAHVRPAQDATMIPPRTAMTA